MPQHSTIKLGDKGPEVKQAQEALYARMIYTGQRDGIFGPITEGAVKDYQMQRSNGWMAESLPLTADGVVADKTWQRLDPGQIKKGASGPAVKLLQELLEDYNYGVGAIDSQFGPKTDAAVKAFQQEAGLQADGIVGPKTWAALRS